MGQTHDGRPHESEASGVERPRRAWGSADVMRVATLVIGLYLLVRLLWFAHLLVLVAFLGILFGLALSAGVDRLQLIGMRRGVGAAVLVIAFFGLLVGFGAFMAPTIHDQTVELERRLPDAVDRVEVWMSSRRTGLVGLAVSGLLSEAPPDTAGRVAVTPPGAAPADSVSLEVSVRQRISSEMRRAIRYLFPFLSSTFAVITGFLIIIFVAIYLAVDPGLYRRGVMQLFPPDQRERAGEVLSEMGDVLRRWLVTQLIAMLAIGVVITIVLMILRVQAAVALGLLGGLLEFIPTVGPIISALPAIGMGFLDSPEKALWVTLAYILVQFFENHMLIPLLMKGRVDLPPVLTVLSQALLAVLFGFLGLMCAVPLLAATLVAVRMIYVEGAIGEASAGSGSGSGSGGTFGGGGRGSGGGPSSPLGGPAPG